MGEGLAVGWEEAGRATRMDNEMELPEGRQKGSGHSVGLQTGPHSGENIFVGTQQNGTSVEVGSSCRKIKSYLIAPLNR